MTGPQPMDHAERMALVRAIAARLREVYAEQLLAVGVYGSVARGTDEPYSDIEMLCVVAGEGVDIDHEWSAGAWKAEVNVLSRDVLRHRAAEVDFDWALTRGGFLHALPLDDPHGIFAEARRVVLDQPPERFATAVRSRIVGEIYEAAGKLRNAAAAGRAAVLPPLAVDLARYGALLLGLAHRHAYTTWTAVLAECLTLTDLPDGYTDLCRMVMAGDLGDPARVIAACEAFWSGVERWATARGIRIHEPDIPF